MRQKKQALSEQAHASPSASRVSAQAAEADFVDNRSASATQRKLTQAIARSDRSVAQGALAMQMNKADQAVAQRGQPDTATARSANHTGLPDGLKAGVESLSGIGMDDVKVHYNSAQPAQLQAHAYAHGTDIHIGPGQEQHLPHEAWHVVQQKQGRVAPTIQAKGGMINDDPALEQEADVMGAKANQQGGGDSLQKKAASGAISHQPSAAVRQRKTLAGLSSGNAVVGTNQVYFMAGPHEVGKYWEMPIVVKDTRTALLQALAKKAGALGHEIDGKVAGPGWNFKADDAEKPGVAFFDPIRVRFQGQYGPNDPKESMTLDYHFGHNWSGYVIHVVDSGKEIDKAMHDPNAVDALDAGTEYSNVHDIDLHPAGPLEQTDSADAITKLAGEGARWRCVGENAGTVRDDTKIYTNENSGNLLTPVVRYVSFQALWKSWQATFNKAYGISDATVVSKLKQINISINTFNGLADQAVSTANSNTMRHGTDISVDDIKPTQQSDLNPKSVRFLHFKKNDSVIDSAQTLEQETVAARTAAGAVPGITPKNVGGYVGKNTFAFLCETTHLANPGAIAGYAHIAENHVDFTYPSYRGPKVETLAKAHAGGKTIGKAAATYAAEKEASYEYYVKEFMDEITYCEAPGYDEIDVEAFVRTALIPWSGAAHPLPKLWYDMTRYEGELADYYEPKIEAYAEQLEQEREKEAEEREKEIDRRIEERIKQEHPYFSSKKKSEQTGIRSEIRKKVVEEIA